MRELKDEELSQISGGRNYRGRDERERLTTETSSSTRSPIQFFQQFNQAREQRERSRFALDTQLQSSQRNRFRPATLSYKTPYLNR